MSERREQPHTATETRFRTREAIRKTLHVPRVLFRNSPSRNVVLASGLSAVGTYLAKESASDPKKLAIEAVTSLSVLALAWASRRVDVQKQTHVDSLLRERSLLRPKVKRLEREVAVYRNALEQAAPEVAEQIALVESKRMKERRRFRRKL